MIPHNWTARPLGEVAEFINGRGFKPHEWATDGLPIIRIQNLNGNNEFNYFNGTYDPKIEVHNGDLLFAWSGSRGSSFGPHFWYGPKSVLNYHTWRVIVSEQVVDKMFMFFALQLLTEQIEDEAHGAAGLVHTQKNRIELYRFSFPPLPEQKAIASVLSTWTRGIQQLRDLITTKNRFKQGLMQQLLSGNRRFKTSAPGEWDHRPIGSFLTESRIPGSHGGDAKKITVKLYGKGVIPKSDTRTGSAATKYYKRQVGQFIYSKLDFLNGAFGIIPEELDGYESTLDLPAFDIGDTVDPSWFRYFVIRESFYKNLLGLANGGRKARRVNPDDLLKVAIPFPTKDEQTHISEVLQTLDQEITLLQKQLFALTQQKKGLMQTLLTGEVRLGGVQ